MQHLWLHVDVIALFEISQVTTNNANVCTYNVRLYQRYQLFLVSCLLWICFTMLCDWPHTTFSHTFSMLDTSFTKTTINWKLQTNRTIAGITLNLLMAKTKPQLFWIPIWTILGGLSMHIIPGMNITLLESQSSFSFENFLR